MSTKVCGLCLLHSSREANFRQLYDFVDRAHSKIESCRAQMNPREEHNALLGSSLNVVGIAAGMCLARPQVLFLSMPADLDNRPQNFTVLNFSVHIVRKKKEISDLCEYRPSLLTSFTTVADSVIKSVQSLCLQKSSPVPSLSKHGCLTCPSFISQDKGFIAPRWLLN